MFYGRFDTIKYQNYGVGVDFYPFKIDNISASIGVGSGVILRKDYSNHTGAFIAPYIRGVITYWFNKWIGFSLRANGQNRPDISKTLIFEGMVTPNF